MFLVPSEACSHFSEQYHRQWCWFIGNGWWYMRTTHATLVNWSLAMLRWPYHANVVKKS